MWQMLKWHTIAAETHSAFPVLRFCNCHNPMLRSCNIIYMSGGSVSCTLMSSKKISQGTPDTRLPQPCQQHGNLSFGGALTKLLTENSAPSSWKAFSFLLCHLWGSEGFENVCQPGERMKYVRWDRRFSCLLHCVCWTCGVLFMHIIIEVPSSGLWCFSTSVSEEHIGCTLGIEGGCVCSCEMMVHTYVPYYILPYHSSL